MAHLAALSILALAAQAGAEEARPSTKELVEQFCQTLNCPRPIDIWVEESLRPLGKKHHAYTTRRQDNQGCRLHFEKGREREPWLVAHEVCHCVFDYAYMGPFGWLPKMPAKEIKYREKMAGVCQMQLTEP